MNQKQENSEQFDCDYTEGIVCPHCGEEYTDVAEWGDEDDEYICDNCGEEFAYSRNVEVTYCSWIVKEENKRKYVVRYESNGKQQETGRFDEYNAKNHADILKNIEGITNIKIIKVLD